MENLLLVFQYLGYTFIRLIQNDHSKAQNVILFFLATLPTMNHQSGPPCPFTSIALAHFNY